MKKIGHILIKNLISAVIFFILLFILIACSHQPTLLELPEFSSFVNDYTGTIDPVWLNKTEYLAAKLEEETGCEVAVAVIETIDGVSIEEYASKLFEKWGIGKKDQDNGLLFLVALDERELRIEVGYGLEGVITDLEAKYIINNVIIPEFKDNDFGRGIHNGVAAISNKIYRDLRLPEISYSRSISSTSKKSSDGFPLSSILTIIIIVIATVLPLSVVGLLVGINFIRYYRRNHRCPKCGKIGLATIRKVLINPTYEYPGRVHLKTTCKYCGFQEESTKNIPRRSKSVSGSISSSFTTTHDSGNFGSSNSDFSSSGSSFGGFGGGSSGGAGASGHW